MKRAKNIAEVLQRGITFIAMNDEESVADARVIAGFVSTICLSEATGYSARYIARQVAQVRRDYHAGLIGGE